jgi:hypothetical protein
MTLYFSLANIFLLLLWDLQNFFLFLYLDRTEMTIRNVCRIMKSVRIYKY